MPRRALVVAALAVAIACGGSPKGSGGGGDGGPASSSGSSDSGSSSSGGSSGSGSSSGSGGSGSGSSSGAWDEGGTGYDGGAPAAVCMPPASLVDVSHPKTVVGTGTPASCTAAALASAVAAGGVVTFDCGPSPVTITVTSEIPVASDTTLDGGKLVTLSGGRTSRILHITSAWNVATPLLTVQNLAFEDGFTTDVPNTMKTTEGGAAIFEDGGSLTVIDCTFTNNQCATSGEDVSGGAINGQGIGTLIVTGSTFSGNTGSNGGAIGTQDENVTVVDSIFVGNSATGTGGNPGNGGDGGAMSYDGAMVSWTMCGDTFSKNHAYQQGGAIFRVAYGDEAVNIDRCTFDGNSVSTSSAISGLAGAAYLEYATITLTNSTLSNNSAFFGGGIWIGHDAIAKLTNDTIARNTATMGGGVWFAGGVTGTFLNVTVADNVGTGIVGSAPGVTLANTIVDGNIAGPMEGETGCDHQLAGGSDNIEYPTDPNPAAACTPSGVVADPELGALANNGGPTLTMAPASGSPAIGKGTGCPATDQRGDPRKSPCTLGAVEVQ